MISQETFFFQGRPVQFDAVRAEGRAFIITGKVVKTASLRLEQNEWMEDVVNPGEVIHALKSSRAKIDLFRFWQRIPDCEPKYPYYKEWRHIAAIPIRDYKHWWDSQLSPKARNKVRKSQKLGVTVETVPFNDELMNGILAIFNESPIRQGMPFWHYGKDFVTAKAEVSADLADSIFIAAHYQNELIGFIKLRFADRYAMITMILDKQTHRDRAPMNAMVAKVVEICAARKIPHVTYTVWRRGGLAQFQESNGFVKITVPEYFVPISVKGALVLRLGLHRGFKALIPEKIMRWLLWLRGRWYSFKYSKISSPDVEKRSA